jgi:hypothetical protein
MNKIWIMMIIFGTIAFGSCETKKSTETSNSENTGDVDSLGTEHENTPPGTETDTFGTNPDK